MFLKFVYKEDRLKNADKILCHYQLESSEFSFICYRGIRGWYAFFKAKCIALMYSCIALKIMLIELKKFGTTLISRQTGKEAALASQSLFVGVSENETIEIDFDGVLTFSPSWGDEFLTPLLNKYGDRLVLKNTSNLSVKATLEILQTTTGKQFKVIS
mgnify:CR=1 FL=1